MSARSPPMCSARSRKHPWNAPLSLVTWCMVLGVCALATPVASTGVALSQGSHQRREAPAVDKAAVEKKLMAKQTQILTIKKALEDEWIVFRNSTQWTLDGCFGVTNGRIPGKSLSGCGSELPSSLSPKCDAFLGDVPGRCGCKGKSVVPHVAVKAMDKVLDKDSERNAANVACFAAGEKMAEAYRKVSGEADLENKLMYFGSADGVMAYYPGVLWARSKDKWGEMTCGSDYDPRKRPWFISGSNGPKNVIFILDTSGSMNQPSSWPRMKLLKDAAKAIMDGLTMSDFVGIVAFSNEARTYKGNKFMGRATKVFRENMNKFIDELEAGGGTLYETAFKRAFEIADNAYSTKYESMCETVYIFLTDGASTEDPTSLITSRQQRLSKEGGRKEMFIIVGLGSAVAPNEKAGITLKKLACDIGGILESVADPVGAESQVVRASEAELSNALASFSRYIQVSNSILRRDVVSFSEIYEGANLPMRMTTAAVPIYDKRNNSRWIFLGVAGIDVTVCDLEEQLYQANPKIQECPPLPEDTVIDGCKCADVWSYKGRDYTGCLEDEDWPFPWCGTSGCGLKVDSVSTGTWADCKPFGVKATLESLFLKSGEECKMDRISNDAIEALRPEQFRCSSNSAASVQTEAASNYFNALPGLAASGANTSMTVSAADWARNGGTSQWDEDAWSTDTSKCDQCASSSMRPKCAKPAKCEVSTVPELCERFSEAPVWVVVVVIIFVVVVLVGCIGGLVFFFCCRTRRNQSVHVASAGQVQPSSLSSPQHQPAQVVVAIPAAGGPPAYNPGAPPPAYNPGAPPPAYNPGAPPPAYNPGGAGPPTASGGAFCGACGKPKTADQRFCSECGATS